MTCYFSPNNSLKASVLSQNDLTSNIEAMDSNLESQLASLESEILDHENSIKQKFKFFSEIKQTKPSLKDFETDNDMQQILKSYANLKKRKNKMIRLLKDKS